MTLAVPTLVLATTNAGKAAEYRELLKALIDLTRVRLVTPADLGIAVPPVEETGATFVENARLKALAYAAATGRPALADDSGLCVDALGGAPGLYSARWVGASASDQDRMALLLEELASIPSAPRAARFVCAVAVATAAGDVATAEGVCHGLIADAPRGRDGFGYDPVFVLPEHGSRTMAELSRGEKNLVSHRAHAFQALLPLMTVADFLRH